VFDGVLSIAPYALLSVAAMATAVLFAVAVGIGVRGKHMLIGSAAMGLMSLWFAGIAIRTLRMRCAGWRLLRRCCGCFGLSATPKQWSICAGDAWLI